MVVKRELVGKVTEVKPVHPLKALVPMVSTESGMVIEVILEHFSKADVSMVVKRGLVGKVIEVKLEHRAKAP